MYQAFKLIRRDLSKEMKKDLDDSKVKMFNVLLMEENFKICSNDKDEQKMSLKHFP